MRFVLSIGLIFIAIRTVQAALPVIEDEERVPFSAWNYAVPATGGSYPYIAYEIKRTGFHTADVHFKNFANKDISFNFWLNGFPQTGEPRVVRVPVSAPDDREWIVPIEMANGQTGLRFAGLKIINIRKEGDARKLASGTIPISMEQPFPPNEAWLSIVTDQPLEQFSSETVAYRVVPEAGQTRVIFRNTGRENVYFDFILKGYQSSDTSKNPRVSLSPGQEMSVPLTLKSADDKLALARIKAFNIRINGDSGAFLDENNMEEGWFAVTAVNSPMVNPNQIMYRFENSSGSLTTIHIRNISRLPITFKFGFSNTPMTTAASIDAEGDVQIPISNNDTSIPLSLRRVRVTDVQYGSLKPKSAATPAK